MLVFECVHARVTLEHHEGDTIVKPVLAEAATSRLIRVNGDATKLLLRGCVCPREGSKLCANVGLTGC